MGSQLLLCLSALGVVYGDIGTSPLYALRECFLGLHRYPPTEVNILGILSLIFWALVIVVSVKYLLFVMRADNRGEGGILALLAILKPWKRRHGGHRILLATLGLFGAALLYGDGVITPAISVLSAVEGLTVATPALKHYVLPITLTILALLFVIQKRGTTGVGSIFGPVMLVWFIVIALLGLRGILLYPHVLSAVYPQHAVNFFLANGWKGYLVLSAVFLAVTGSEALYADMGHFGRPPIRYAWFCLVFPALLLNYFGQGALLLTNPAEVTQPFFHLAPSWAIYPLVLLSTLATVIASQAVVSGAFSLTRQAVQLGLTPRMRIIQTSSEEIGQIYIPAVNWLLMIAVMALVLGFRESGNLAVAYGVAVTTTMVITTVLVFFVMRERWQWRPVTAWGLSSLFLLVDLAFFGSNMLKVEHGGWVPLTAGGAVFIVMSTWRRGREILAKHLQTSIESLDVFFDRIAANPPLRVAGTAVFMSGRRSGIPPMLHHHLIHNQVLHEQVVILTVVIEEVPRVPAAERLEVTQLSHGFARVVVHYGYLQSPHVPVALRECQPYGLTVDLEKTTYYLGRETLIPTPKILGMMFWREKLFAFMSRNSLQATAFFNIPPERVVELGLQIEI
ncbi:MAG TPA: potassium transporter Kup [Dongiaceae bacterium]|nr:potassium transporter Kup [Dongiaceae bacterium]